MRGEGSNMVTYRWDRHAPKMVDNLNKLLVSENSQAGVTLMTETGAVSVDRLLLSASSPYFRSPFSLSPSQ